MIISGEVVSPAIAVVELQAITLLVDALNVPEEIEIDVEGKEDGFQLFAGDVTLPQGTELVSDPELLVISVAEPRVEEESEDEAAEGETEAAEESAEEE